MPAAMPGPAHAAVCLGDHVDLAACPVNILRADAQKLSGTGAAGDRELQQGAVPFAPHGREQLVQRSVGDRPRRLAGTFWRRRARPTTGLGSSGLR